MGAIFLSAGIPQHDDSSFGQDCEPQIIQAAISAFSTVTMGRKKIIWGGHPAITPMMWASAQDLGTQYANAVSLFQSKYFEEDFPEENKHFKNVTYISAKSGNLIESMRLMREAMLQSEQFDAAVFIGGMQGILDEYSLFKKFHPHAKCVVVAATGGGARLLAKQINQRIQEDLGPFDFIRLFYRELNISPKEERRSLYKLSRAPRPF